MVDNDRPKYLTRKAEIDQEIEILASKYSTPQTAEIFRHIFTTIIKLHLDKAKEFDLRLINTALKELRHAFRIFSKYREIPKVTIWGSSRISRSSKEYKIALEFSQAMVKKGFMVITGAGGGVMEAGNRAAGEKSFGINIGLPTIQPANPYIAKGEKLIDFKYFFTRKLIFVKESDATALFPGGFGTLDEAFEILTLFQTGKTAPRPIILINAPESNYWKSWLNFAKNELVRPGFISPADLKLFRIVDSAREAVAEITNYYRVYHSIRFVGPSTILRLKKPLTISALNGLNSKFSDILLDGKIEVSGPTSEEIKDDDHADLPRLKLVFDRKNYGRLNELIRHINRSSG